MTLSGFYKWVLSVFKLTIKEAMHSACILCVWPLYLDTMSVGFISVAVYGKATHCFIAASSVWMNHGLFIHFTVGTFVLFLYGTIENILIPVAWCLYVNISIEWEQYSCKVAECTYVSIGRSYQTVAQSSCNSSQPNTKLSQEFIPVASYPLHSVQFSSVTQSCPTFCDPMNHSTPGLPVYHQLLEFTQTHVHRVSDAISSSVTPFSSCSQSLPASGSFPVSQIFTSGGQGTGASASASVLPMSIQDWFPLGWTGLISLLSKGLWRVFSNTTVQNHQFFGAQLSLWSSSLIHTRLLEKP